MPVKAVELGNWNTHARYSSSLFLTDSKVHKLQAFSETKD